MIRTCDYCDKPIHLGNERIYRHSRMYCSTRCAEISHLSDFNKPNQQTTTKVTPEAIQKACNELAQILINKNADYGNSVEEQFEEYGDSSLHIRLEDKLRRLKNLSKKESKVNEKKAETWIDAAGYSILAYIIHSEE